MRSISICKLLDRRGGGARWLPRSGSISTSTAPISFQEPEKHTNTKEIQEYSNPRITVKVTVITVMAVAAVTIIIVIAVAAITVIIVMADAAVTINIVIAVAAIANTKHKQTNSQTDQTKPDKAKQEKTRPDQTRQDKTSRQ